MGTFVQPASIKAIAETVDVTGLSEEAAKALAPDVEYRLREVIQDALKFARHSKRSKLTTEDISNALRMRNIEPVYGFAGNQDRAKFIKATGHSDLYFVQDPEVPLDAIITTALPKPPSSTTVMPHWLFIQGVQPRTDENTPVDRPVAKRARLQQQQALQQHRQVLPLSQQQQGGLHGLEGLGEGAVPAAQVALPVQHVLTDELQQLFQQIKLHLQPPPSSRHGPGAGMVVSEGGVALGLALTPMQESVLAKIKSEPGMAQMVPHFVQYITSEVSSGLRSLARLHTALRAVRALAANPHARAGVEAQLVALMPAIMTCMLAKSLGSFPTEDHWAVRDRAAALLVALCTKYDEPFYALQKKVSKQLLKTLLDASKTLPSHYGAIAGLAALGHNVVRTLLIPHLDPYVKLLTPLLRPEEREAICTKRQLPASGSAAAGASGTTAANGSKHGEAGPSPGPKPMDVDANKDGLAGHGHGNGSAAAGASVPGHNKPQQLLSSSASYTQHGEAWRVYGLLVDVVSAAAYDRLLSMAADGMPHQLMGMLRKRAPPKAIKPKPSGSTRPQTGTDERSATPAAASTGPTASPSSQLAASQEAQILARGVNALWRSINSGQIPQQTAAQLGLNGMGLEYLRLFDEGMLSSTALHKLVSKTVLEVVRTAGSTANAAALAHLPCDATTQTDTKPVEDSHKDRAAELLSRKQTDLAAEAACAAAEAALRTLKSKRSVHEVLLMSYEDGSDVGDLMWALSELFGEHFLTRMPQPARMPSMLL